MQIPGLLVVSTISKEDGDCICRSFDYGQHWEVILYDLSIGRMDFRTSYMTPQYNGGHNLIHWLTDIKINPFHPQELWFNTGTGVFRTKNLLEDSVVFSDWCDGLEETVHLNLYSPPKGEVQLIDILGDLGGFAFRDIDRPCDNSFADADGNRYITCINADYAENAPNCVIVTPRGNWTGKTKGGLILSKDQCRTFVRLSMPYGITEKIDRALANIERPNVNSGWAALSPDGKNIVWSVADLIFLPADMVLTSRDGGNTFQKANVYDLDGRCISDYCVAEAEPILNHLYPDNENRTVSGNDAASSVLQKIPLESNSSENVSAHEFGGEEPEPAEIVYAYGMKVFSDRVDPELFYGFGRHFEFYVSCDGGATFYQKALPADAPCADFSIIDTANKTEVRADSRCSGRIYMALREHGLYRLDYDKQTDHVSLKKLGRDGDIFYRMGLGVQRPDADSADGGDISESGTDGTINRKVGSTCGNGADADSSKSDKDGIPGGGGCTVEIPAIYTAATINGIYGFYRTEDEGKSFVRLNTDNQMFGEINSIEGDSRVFGRFYIATGSRGVLYGEPI
jgi:hypothetical protein